MLMPRSTDSGQKSVESVVRERRQGVFTLLEKVRFEPGAKERDDGGD